VSRHCLKWIYPAYLRYKPIELRTSSLHTFQNNHIDNNKTFFTRGVAVEDRQKGSGLIKAAIWTPFIAVAGLWRRHRAPLRFLPAPRNNSSALIYTHTHTLALSESTLPLALNSTSDLQSLRQQDAWMDRHSYLPPPLTISHTHTHTHNKSALQTLSGPHNFVCMCDKACPLIVSALRTDSIIIKHTGNEEVREISVLHWDF